MVYAGSLSLLVVEVGTRNGQKMLPFRRAGPSVVRALGIATPNTVSGCIMLCVLKFCCIFCAYFMAIAYVTFLLYTFVHDI